MGEARRKLEAESKLVEVDFAKVGFVFSRQDRMALRDELEDSYAEDDPDALERRVYCRPASILCTTAIRTHFKDGITKREAKLWAVWREVFAEDSPSASLPWGAIDWLRAILNNEELKLPPDLAQWWEALTAYFTTLQPEAPTE